MHVHVVYPPSRESNKSKRWGKGESKRPPLPGLDRVSVGDLRQPLRRNFLSARRVALRVVCFTERQVQQQGSQRAEALAERSVEIAQAMVPLAGALARGGG